MDHLFENVKMNTTDIPIVMIDKSGSTRHSMKTGKTILNTFANIIQTHLKSYDKQQCHVLFWCDECHYYDDIIPISEIELIINDVENISDMRRGNTDISVAFENMPKEWLLEGKTIYILTDGDINSDEYEFATQIKSLMITHDDLKIHIISVENNKDDYNIKNIDAGNKIYRMIKENNLTQHVKSFVSYNNIYTTNHYVNMYNPDLHDGYIPYENKCFPVTKTNLFVQYIGNIIKQTDEMDLNKIIHNLTFTLHHLVKNKPIKIQNDIIDMFCTMFPMNYDEIKNLLISEIKNHKDGISNTFQEYQSKRNKLFERANDCINMNTSESISCCKQASYLTIPINTTNGLVVFECNKATDSVKIGSKIYNNGGIKIDNHVIPIFPKKIMKYEFKNQCLRQWIRAIYSKIFNKTVNSDIILYKFLTEVLKIYLSDVDNTIKDTYIEMALIMLDRRRYQSGGIKEIEHLMTGNPPLPVYDDFSKMDDILRECAIDFGIEPYTLWYAIVSMLGNITLMNNQLKYCKESLKKDKLTVFNLLKKLKAKSQINIKHIKLNITEYEYYDYITLENTSEIGGYGIPSHTIGEYICNPKYVVSNACYDELKTKQLSCPICHADIDNFEKIQSKSYYDELNQNVLQANNNIISEYFNINSHKIVTVDDLVHDIKTQNNLILIDDLDFQVASYEFGIPHIINEMNPYMLINNTTNKFMSIVKEKYSFLMLLDITNVCLAGGFCRSILLDQEVNDFDFFLYGLSDDEMIVRLKKLVNDIVMILGGTYMILYKMNTNVLELLRVNDLGQLTHKLQIILVNNQNIEDLFGRFDLDSCCVALAQQPINANYGVYFCKRSYTAYKYMINVVNEKAYTISYDHRLKKYYEKGFAIGLLRFDLDNFDSILDENDDKYVFDEYNDDKIIIRPSDKLVLGNCNFGKCIKVGNKIIINSFNVNSKNIDEIVGDSLYESSCVDTTKINFVDDTLKYIESINKDKKIINHKLLFSDTNPLNDKSLSDKFYNDLFGGEIKIISSYDYRLGTVDFDFDWYGKFGKSDK